MESGKKPKMTRLLLGEDTVVDTNVLQDLFELGALEILFKTFRSVQVVDVLYEAELLEPVRKQLDSYSYERISVNTPEGLEVLGKLYQVHSYKRLSDFDRILIAAATQQKCLCTSNDGLIRKACEEFGIQITGTVGILCSALEKEHIDLHRFTELINLLRSEGTTCYLSEAMASKAIADAEEWTENNVEREVVR